MVTLTTGGGSLKSLLFEVKSSTRKVADIMMSFNGFFFWTKKKECIDQNKLLVTSSIYVFMYSISAIWYIGIHYEIWIMCIALKQFSLPWNNFIPHPRGIWCFWSMSIMQIHWGKCSSLSSAKFCFLSGFWAIVYGNCQNWVG